MPKVILIHNDYPDKKALENVIHYVMDKASLCGSYAVACDANAAVEQMWFVKAAFHKEYNLQLKHFIISFANNEMDMFDSFDDLMQMGFAVGQLFNEYQMVYGVHLDSGHIHVHFVMNTTSFLDGHQYHDGLPMFCRLCDLLRDRYPKCDVDLYHTERYSKSNPYTRAHYGKYQQFK